LQNQRSLPVQQRQQRQQRHQGHQRHQRQNSGGMGWQGGGANARRNKAAKGRVTAELLVHAFEESAATRRAPFLPCSQRPAAATHNVCFVSSKDEAFAEEAAASSDGVCLLYARTFAQCVVSAIPCDDLPAGVVVLSEHQRENLEVTVGDRFQFSVFTDAADVLSDVTVSVMPRHALAADEAAIEIDGPALARAVKQFLFQTVVTRHELFLLEFQGCALVAYVTECNLPFDAAADAAAVVVADTFRGVVSSGTAVGLAVNDKAATVDAERFHVRDPPRIQPQPKPRALVNVITNDDVRSCVPACVRVRVGVLACARMSTGLGVMVHSAAPI
jgi:hypothetical protein